jgi:hypothetical protein
MFNFFTKHRHLRRLLGNAWFTSNGLDTDRSVSRFTSVGLVRGPPAVRRTVSDRCEPRTDRSAAVRVLSVTSSRTVRGLFVSDSLDLNRE